MPLLELFNGHNNNCYLNGSFLSEKEASIREGIQSVILPCWKEIWWEKNYLHLKKDWIVSKFYPITLNCPQIMLPNCHGNWRSRTLLQYSSNRVTIIFLQNSLLARRITVKHFLFLKDTARSFYLGWVNQKEIDVLIINILIVIELVSKMSIRRTWFITKLTSTVFYIKIHILKIISQFSWKYWNQYFIY